MTYTPQTTFAGGVHPAGLHILPGEKDDTRSKILRLSVNGISRSRASERIGVTYKKVGKLMDAMVACEELRIETQTNAGTNRPVQMYFRNERVIQ